MFQIRKMHLFALLGLIAPVCYAGNFCIAVDNGFGKGGASFVGVNFSLPGANSCKPWSGFTKTGSSVVAFTSGVGCLSSNSKVLTLSVFSTDPDFFSGSASNYITLCPKGVSGCPISGFSHGSEFAGNAVEQTCTTTLDTLPASHD
jgi:hypothetical protein